MQNEALFYSIISWIHALRILLLEWRRCSYLYKNYDNHLINVDPLLSLLTHIFLNQW